MPILKFHSYNLMSTKEDSMDVCISGMDIRKKKSVDSGYLRYKQRNADFFSFINTIKQHALNTKNN